VEFKSYFANITEEFMMICDDGWLADLILAMGFIGLAAGSVLLSWMSSYFGRRLVLGIGHLLCTVFIGV